MAHENKILRYGFPVLFAAVAIVSVVYVWSRNRVVPVADPGRVEPTTAVEQTLGAGLLNVRPDAGSIDEVAGQIEDRALAVLSENERTRRWSAEMRVDLASAFAARWRALVDPDPARDHGSLAERGDPKSAGDALAEFEAQRSWHESLRMAAVGPGGLVVFDLSESESGSDAYIYEGFRRQLTRRDTDPMPVPQDPVDAGWPAAEVLVPIEKQPMRVTGGGEARGVVLVGFRFAWSGRDGHWVPYAAVMCADPNEIHGAVPFR